MPLDLNAAVQKQIDEELGDQTFIGVSRLADDEITLIFEDERHHRTLLRVSTTRDDPGLCVVTIRAGGPWSTRGGTA